METTPLLPNRERLSAVMAVILLAYVAARFVQAPIRVLNLGFLGVYLPIQFSINTLLAVLAACLTASGADWLLRDQPGVAVRSPARHWLLPAMTAWVLSLLLSNLGFGLAWWLAFGGSALLLLTILIAEYHSARAESRLHTAATLVLTTLSFVLFLMLAISIRGLGLRLFLALPAIGLGAFLCAARVNLLRVGEDWHPLQLVAITYIAGELAAGLHYLPVSALGFGLFLLGLLFALVSFAAQLNAGLTPRQASRELAIALIAFWLLALLVS